MFKKTTLLFAALMAAMLCTSAWTEEPAAKPAASEDLSAAIKKGIELIEGKKTAEFLERFILPTDLAQAKKSGHWDDIVAEYNKHADMIAKILKATQDLKPELTENGAHATYDVSKIEGDHQSTIHFRKVKDVWYIADK